MAKESFFTPEQLKQAQEFVIYKDLITTITDPNKTYTKAEIQALINAYLNKEVQ